MLTTLLFFPAAAHDLTIRVDVPGGAPVWTTILDAQPGSTQTITFPGDKRTVYRLVTTVDPPSGDHEWRVTFELSEGRGKTFAVLMRPTMQADAGKTARVTMGTYQAVEGSEAPATTFHGYEIEWTASEPEP